MDIVGPTVPTLPEAAFPVIASVLAAATVPTKPAAFTPVSAAELEATTEPTFPEADTPVRATVTVTPDRELNGASENADEPNIDYAVLPRSA
jgi:hypothetical protein